MYTDPCTYALESDDALAALMEEGYPELTDKKKFDIDEYINGDYDYA
tara:strand:+ start:349 stop:489 length:141 start_codon:yes stop_codon:yes gene_type:complete